MRQIEHLYHLAEATNVPSILKHGLLSTSELLKLTSIDANERRVLLRTHRPTGSSLDDGVYIRDQSPMPPAALSKALKEGMEPADWYELLNGFVFLWPDRDRMDRHRAACKGRPQVVLTFDAAALFKNFEANGFVSPINSGSARRKPAVRGRETLRPYTHWLKHGWPDRARSHPPAEILFNCSIPARAPYLIGAEEV
jgi:hypothetical protein